MKCRLFEPKVGLLYKGGEAGCGSGGSQRRAKGCGTCASPPRARARMSASSLAPMVAETVKMDCQLVAAAARPKAAEGMSGIEEPADK